jgi:hypothetical protein
MAACGVVLLASALLLAESEAPGLMVRATTANVTGAPDAVRIEVLRWSTEQERERVVNAWELKAPAGGAGAGKGAAKAGRGAAKAPEPGAPNTATPDGSVTAALQEMPTVGYLWTSEMAGYAVRYAGRVANADGSQRVVLLTQRRLGSQNQAWRAASGAANGYGFSVIELRLNAKGEGEGKASVVGTVAMDAAAKVVTLADYAAAPVVFRDVRPQEVKIQGKP